LRRADFGYYTGPMFDEPIDRAQWLATYIMPIEPESRGWVRRVAPPGLEVDDVIQEAYKILAGLGYMHHRMLLASGQGGCRALGMAPIRP
jgi:hypothetical protein